MRKILFVLIVSFALLTGCKGDKSVKPWPPTDDPWQRYQDGTPGVVDLRLSKGMENGN